MNDHKTNWGIASQPTPPTPQPEPPTDTERAHAFEWLCTKCGKRGMPGTHVTYEETHDGCGGVCQSVPIKPEPQQSAGEWVRSMIIPESDGPVDFSPEHLPSPKALELAQRCDEAEAQVKRYDGYHSALVTESCDLRAQLAAAHAEAARLREEIHSLKRLADFYSHQVAPLNIVKMFEDIEDAAIAALAKKEGKR